MLDPAVGACWHAVASYSACRLRGVTRGCTIGLLQPSIDDSRRAGSDVIVHTRVNRSISASMSAGRNVERYWTRRSSSLPGGLDSKRVVVVVAAAELGDGQLVVARQRGGVGWVVLVHETVSNNLS